MAFLDQSESGRGRPRTISMDHPADRMWWHFSPRRFLRRILVVAAAMAFIMIGLSNWLQQEWEKAPTRYPDGRVEYRHQSR